MVRRRWAPPVAGTKVDPAMMAAIGVAVSGSPMPIGLNGANWIKTAGCLHRQFVRKKPC